MIDAPVRWKCSDASNLADALPFNSKNNYSHTSQHISCCDIIKVKLNCENVDIQVAVASTDRLCVIPERRPRADGQLLSSVACVLAAGVFGVT